MSLRIQAALCAALLSAPLLLAPAAPALAHARLRQAQPPVDGSVPAGVQEVRITCSEAVEPQFCQVALTGPDGKPVQAAAPGTDPADAKVLVLRPSQPLQPGACKVEWHATSVDTHKTEGSYGFTVRP